MIDANEQRDCDADASRCGRNAGANQISPASRLVKSYWSNPGATEQRRDRHYQGPEGVPLEANSNALFGFQASVTSGSVLRRSSRIDGHATLQEASRYRMHEKERWNALGQTETTVSTAYKRKADKVRPVDESLTDGSVPGGRLDWEEHVHKRQLQCLKLNWHVSCPPQLHALCSIIEPRYATFPRGHRLTPERVSMLKMNEGLQPHERELMLEVLYHREPALSWTFGELGNICHEVAPPQQIRVIDHKAWQVPGFPVPRRLAGEVAEMLQDRLNAGKLEYAHSPYRNPWFLVKKKSGKHRMVNAAMNINAVTIRDANLPPSVDELSEALAGCHIMSLLDFHSGYDQVELDKSSRDITAFQTPLGLLRMTTLPQGATNSVAQFVRISSKIMAKHRDRTYVFVDDVAVKGPKTNYASKEVFPGVRQFVWEHILDLDRILASVERAGATIAGDKVELGVYELEVVGYICDKHGRRPTSSKVEKLWKRDECVSVTDARAFMGLCTYYRVWVKDFSQIAEPIFRLFRTGESFFWGDEQANAMRLLRNAITSAPALVSLNYDDGAGEIIMAVDASGTGWGAHLCQVGQDGRRHPVRFESGFWSLPERKYDAGKLECKALLHGLRRFRTWLYGVRFTVETDANTLVAQLNRTATDMPGALMTRWLAWIHLWDFDVRHIPGKKNGVADGLSRQVPLPDEVLNDVDHGIDDMVDADLDVLYVRPVELGDTEEAPVLQPDAGYSEQSLAIANWLTTMQRPEGLTGNAFTKFKRWASRFMVQGGHLFHKAGRNRPLRRVLDDVTERRDVLRTMHEQHGHRGREGTYRTVSWRYWWPGLFGDCQQHVGSCRECQMRSTRREHEQLTVSSSSHLQQRWSLDVCKIDGPGRFSHIVIARNYLSGWPEARAFTGDPTSAKVARFLWEDVICRHGIFEVLTVDGGRENKGLVQELMSLTGTKKIVITPYNAQANGLIEVGHKPIVQALSKLSQGTGKNWERFLHAALWADRTTVKKSTGRTPVWVHCGEEHVLPIELSLPTWQTLPWGSVKTTAELIEHRTKQLILRDEDLHETASRTLRLREQAKEYWEDRRHMRERQLRVGDLVLRWNNLLSQRLGAKIGFKWLGPYRIHTLNEATGAVTIMELDGTVLADRLHLKDLKLFIERQLQDVREGDRLRRSGDDPADSQPDEDSDDEEPLQFAPHQQPQVTVRIPAFAGDRSQYEDFTQGPS